MKVVKIQAENFKKLVAVEIEPGDQSVMKISGKNGAGKTSVLDSIWVALGGHKATKNLPEPVRKGEEKAVISLDLGDLVIVRRFNAKGTTSLVVKNAEGEKISSPQKILDELVGEMAFDPLSFTRLSPKEQQETLLGLIDLDFDLNDLDERYKKFYDDRRHVNRNLRDTKGAIEQHEGIGFSEEDLDSDPPDVSEIIEELEDARANNRKINELDETLDKKASELENLERRVEELQQEILEGQSDFEEMEIIDTDAIKDRLEAAQSDLSMANEHAEYKRLCKERDNLETKSERLSARMKKIKSKKERALQEADMPIDGLGFNEDGHVTYNGNPFEQCSAAEQLRISVAMAMALNPEVRVIRITDGSLLDEDSMDIIEELAGENDYQVWMEVVDSSGEVGLMIEDGEIVGNE